MLTVSSLDCVRRYGDKERKKEEEEEEEEERDAPTLRNETGGIDGGREGWS